MHKKLLSCICSILIAIPVYYMNTDLQQSSFVNCNDISSPNVHTMQHKKGLQR